MKNLIMFKTVPEDYKKFIIHFGIIPTLILMDKFENLEMYEECGKILKAINSINKKAKIYKDTKLNDEIINDVIDDYRKMGFEDMTKEMLMIRSERYASRFISENSFVIFTDKKS